MNALGIFICNNQKLETIQMSTDRWMYTQLLYLYSRKELSNKKEQTINLYKHRNGSQNNCTEGKKPDQNEYMLSNTIYMKF